MYWGLNWWILGSYKICGERSVCNLCFWNEGIDYLYECVFLKLFDRNVVDVVYDLGYVFGFIVWFFSIVCFICRDLSVEDLIDESFWSGLKILLYYI